MSSLVLGIRDLDISILYSRHFLFRTFLGPEFDLKVDLHGFLIG